ncbi:hypothetical protein CBW65_05880 [Tumebacillus avium]|uniref:Type III toxin-antitoxin system ToxN/AbiQ family toxin n=1 Tax=Tumebacillus avium TaxID=1903704 RepID=A0A1Y0IMT1_9BACL|nr:hypothetical protein [Tumebacillus avium]ARU60664.1 hypothetical protein CBW65_05880 [Tumebacillus avium]
MATKFKVYKLSKEFYQVCDWSVYNIPVKNGRPTLLLVLNDEKFPDSYCCIPISKDDDKNGKYRELSRTKKDLVHHVPEISKYDNYLLIQNMFFVHKDFIGDPFEVEGIEVEIKNEKRQREITKKVKKVDALLKKGTLKYVPREEVFKRQLQYLEEKKRTLSTV